MAKARPPEIWNGFMPWVSEEWIARSLFGQKALNVRALLV
jgi:hypothetical protein